MELGFGQRQGRSTWARAMRRLALFKVPIERASSLWAALPLVFLDALCIVLSMTAAYYLRFQLLQYHAPVSAAFYTRLTLVAIPMWLLIFVSYRLYHPDNLFGGLGEYASVFNACTVGLVGLVLYGFLDRRAGLDISRGWLAMVWFFSVASVTWFRFGYRRLIYRLRKRGLFVRRALIVGANEEGAAVVSQLRASPIAGVQVVGFVDAERSPGTTVERVPVLGNLDKLESMIERLGVEEVILIPTAIGREGLLKIYRDWGTDRRVRLSLSSGLYELFTTGVQVKEVGFVPLVSLDRTRITGVDRVLKAVLDYVGAGLGLVLLSPVLLFIAILVRRDSPGPVIHRRRVTGLHGREFDAFKFRTMIVDANDYLKKHPQLQEEWDRTGKIQDDPRITRIGRTLRRYSLDELPQLFNVLVGDMSLVGPRMLTPAELTHFGHWQHNLLTVKPGITGLWQVSGRSHLPYEERVRLDMHYIRNHTVWLDLKVLFNTVRTVIEGEGAY